MDNRRLLRGGLSSLSKNEGWTGWGVDGVYFLDGVAYGKKDLQMQIVLPHTWGSQKFKQGCPRGPPRTHPQGDMYYSKAQINR